MAAGDCDIRITKPRAFNSNVFDGVDDYIEIPHNAAQLGANLSNGFTISAWINPRSIGESAGYILDKSSDANAANGFRFYLDGGGMAVRFTINNGTTKGSGAGTLTYGVFAHYLLTVTSAQLITFYKNGSLSGTANQDLIQAISTITTTNAMRIGNRATATDRTFDGSIRSVKMWNRVLTSTEIAQDYAGETVSSGLIHNFKLGGDYTDYGSVGVTATNSGSIVQTVEDTIAIAVKAQRVLTTSSGRIIMTGHKSGQVITAGITE
jgi:hypothetical protein